MYQHKVQYYETDQMGIVHHANYIRWFEEARMDWMKEHGISYKDMETDGILIPVLSVEATYRMRVCFDDQVKIKVNLEKYNGIILDFSYEILEDKTERLCTSGKSRHCFLNKEAKPLSLKNECPKWHHKFCEL